MARQKSPSPSAAELAILAGRIPFENNGRLNFSKRSTPFRLPDNLCAESLNLDDARGLEQLPANLHVNLLRIGNCTQLHRLPPDLRCRELHAPSSGLREIPPGVQISYRLDATECVHLRSIGDNLPAKSIQLGGCVSLQRLPENLDSHFLTLRGCTSLMQWPKAGRLSVGGLNMRDCPQLDSLPPWLGEIAQLNISGCVRIRELPPHTVVTSWIDLAGTGITSLPAGCQGAALRWRGVFISPRIAFQPDSISADEVLAERNAELRRVLLERMGYARFMEEAKAEILHTDHDAGGERKLVRVPLPRDEDLVCIMVRCPSTGREYVIRVPPTTRTCRKAAAWIAGFEDETDYRPLAET